MAEAIAAPDFAFGDSSILGEIIDFEAPDNALELGPLAGVSIFDGALAFLCTYSLYHRPTTCRTSTHYVGIGIAS